MSRNFETTDYYRLTSSLLSKLGEVGWPKTRAFATHYRKKNVGQVERFYAKLSEGHGAPEAIVRGFFEYLAETKKLPQYTFENGAMPTVAQPSSQNERYWFSWDAIGEHLNRPFLDNDLMYLDDPDEDIPLIVTAFCTTIGRINDPRASDADALNQGERIRGMTVTDQSAWLRSLYIRPYRTIMYAVEAGVRVGAMAIIPVTEVIFRKMTKGEMRPEEITPSMLPPRDESKHLWIETFTPFGIGESMSVAERSQAETHTFMYQMAYHTRALRKFYPVPFGLYTHDFYRQRYERFGFRPTGACMKSTSYPIVALQPPAGRFALPSWSYEKMRAAMRPYRRANRRIWAEEDRHSWEE